VNAVHPGNVATDMLLNDALFKVFRPDLENPTRTDAEPVMAAMHRPNTPLTSGYPVRHCLGSMLSAGSVSRRAAAAGCVSS
jgi:hypothetical protein